MKTSKYGSNLYQLTRWGMFNCYLVQEEDGVTLIDTGMAGSENEILISAAQAGFPIKRIALTHGHTDHVGSLDALQRLLPTVEITATQRTARFLSGDLSLDPSETHSQLKGGFVKCQVQPNRLIQPGDMVGSLQVVSAPGHSPDHVAFLDIRDGTLIAGDAFQTKAGIAVSGTMRWLFPFPALATWNKSIAVETAQQLLALSPKRLAVGHGPVLENPIPAMRSAIQTAKRN